ncbi:MAG: Unknown protein [uncultured Sulfurovum sp.]|uniref:DUF255 domain-containing protein n=1 Tax=uncultured Sulfurovum sp. TaxID=269237 RepID=A0A6S6TLQ7_9BACT|nr:MAG: Unknown protein [uncultured Sulfurovum sp.]
MKTIMLLSFLFGSVFMIKEQAFVSSEKMTYEKALSLSKQNNKPIMLKLTAENCKYCTKMDREVLENEEVKTLLSENFISVTVNVDKEEIPLGIKREITPTFIFIDKEGKILSKLPGSWGKKDFMDLLRNRI